MNKIMIAVGAQTGTFHVNLQRATPTRMAVDCDLSEELRSTAKVEEGTPHLLTLHHDVSTVEFGANLGTAHYMNGLDAALEMHPLTHSATLAYEHISTMLTAYVRAAAGSAATLSHYLTVPVERENNSTVEITADAVADYAPILEKAVEICVDIGSELHAGAAGHGIHHAEFSVTPAANAVSAIVPYMGEIPQAYQLVLLGELIKCQSVRGTAHIRTGIAFNGLSHVCPTEGRLEAACGFRQPEIVGTMTVPEALRLPSAAGHQSHLTEAALKYINGILSVAAEAEIRLDPSSELGFVYCADLQGSTAMEVILQAIVDAEGGGWQYPVIVETDAAIFQVWLTEQNRKHLFLDPLQSIHHAEVVHGISGNIDKQFRVDAASESSHFLSVSGELHKRQRGDWEYPVLSEGVMLITQAIDALPHYQYNLEVR